MKNLAWHELDCVWYVTMNVPGACDYIQADFVYLATGLLYTAKIPDIQGMNPFKGKVVHISRWDYTFTGGCQAQPDMTELRNKRVGVVGTGAIAVQILLELARWAKEVVVSQRTAPNVYPPTMKLLMQRASSWDQGGSLNAPRTSTHSS